MPMYTTRSDPTAKTRRYSIGHSRKDTTQGRTSRKTAPLRKVKHEQPRKKAAHHAGVFELDEGYSAQGKARGGQQASGPSLVGRDALLIRDREVREQRNEEQQGADRGCRPRAAEER